MGKKGGWHQVSVWERDYSGEKPSQFLCGFCLREGTREGRGGEWMGTKGMGGGGALGAGEERRGEVNVVGVD